MLEVVMSMNFLTPRSRPGWWAGWFAAGSAAMMLVGPAVAGISMIGKESPSATGLLTAMAAVATLCMVGGTVAAIFALRRGDHSAPVWAALAFGAFAFLFLAGELVLPH
jgi:hypothetical protein